MSVSGERPADHEAEHGGDEQCRPGILFHHGLHVCHHAFGVVGAHVVGCCTQTVCCRRCHFLHSLPTWELAHSFLDRGCDTFQPVRSDRSAFVDLLCCRPCHVGDRIFGLARSVSELLAKRCGLVCHRVIYWCVSARHRMPLFLVPSLLLTERRLRPLVSHPRGESVSRMECGCSAIRFALDWSLMVG